MNKMAIIKEYSTTQKALYRKELRFFLKERQHYFFDTRGVDYQGENTKI